MTCPLTQCERDGIKNAVESTMFDTCLLGNRNDAASWGSSVAGEAVWDYDITETACGLNDNKSRQVADGSDATITEAVIRLPLASVVNSSSRIQVVGRFGATLATPLFYEIVGNPRIGVSSITCNCNRITGESRL